MLKLVYKSRSSSKGVKMVPIGDYLLVFQDSYAIVDLGPMGNSSINLGETGCILVAFSHSERKCSNLP